MHTSSDVPLVFVARDGLKNCRPQFFRIKYLLFSIILRLFSIGPTLLNKKAFNDFFFTSAKHQ